MKPRCGQRIFCKTLTTHVGSRASLELLELCLYFPTTLQTFQDWIFYLEKWSCLTWRLINIITHGLHVWYIHTGQILERENKVTDHKVIWDCDIFAHSAVCSTPIWFSMTVDTTWDVPAGKKKNQKKPTNPKQLKTPIDDMCDPLWS